MAIARKAITSSLSKWVPKRLIGDCNASAWIGQFANTSASPVVAPLPGKPRTHTVVRTRPSVLATDTDIQTLQATQLLYTIHTRKFKYKRKGNGAHRHALSRKSYPPRRAFGERAKKEKAKKQSAKCKSKRIEHGKSHFQKHAPTVFSLLFPLSCRNTCINTTLVPQVYPECMSFISFSLF